MKMIWNKLTSLLSRAVLASGAWIATAAHAVNDLPGGPAVRQLNLHPPVTKIAEEQQWLHWFMLILCSVIFVAVFAVMFYSIWKHRKSVGHKAANFHESVTVEVIWTIVPFIIVILMALPATKVVVALKDTSNADLTIKATGMQWKWGYDYIKGEGEGISFVSTLDSSHRAMSNAGGPPKGQPVDDYLLKVDNALVVPVNKKVRIITTANDVIHAFMVPAFGIKQDAIPGFVRDTWFRAEKTGDFYGQCAELCGKEHAYMPIHVKVVSAEDYAVWVDGERKKAAAKLDDPTKVWTLDDITKRGERVYAANCAACHQATGLGLPGAFPPLKDNVAVQDADPAKHIEVILKGLQGQLINGTSYPTAMPPFAAALSDADIADIANHERNSWGNQGKLISAEQVKEARGK
ncbi:MAG: cytochrome c oxidase subunit II [Rhodanobacter sp.]